MIRYMRPPGYQGFSSPTSLDSFILICPSCPAMYSNAAATRYSAETWRVVVPLILAGTKGSATIRSQRSRLSLIYVILLPPSCPANADPQTTRTSGGTRVTLIGNRVRLARRDARREFVWYTPSMAKRTKFNELA